MNGTEMALERADVAIIGAGPAGLAAAAELASHNAGKVLVLERELRAGGIPRHAHHQGYGLRDLRRPLSGPAYAARRVELAELAGAELRTTATQVTGWSPTGELELTGPAGRTRLRATGAPGHGLPGAPTRGAPGRGRSPAGSHDDGHAPADRLPPTERPGHRALVVGAEHVSFSALLTLAHGGASVAGLVTPLAHHQSYAVFRGGAALRFRVPLRTRTEIIAIHGRGRVQEVTLKDLSTGTTWREPCDIVVFTGDWIPDHELAILGGIHLDRGTLGPAVDPSLRTSRPGSFAAGNVLQGAETADIAALQGHHAAERMLEHRRSGTESWPGRRIAIEIVSPLHWISPNTLAGDERPRRPRSHLRVRAHEELLAPVVEVSQGDSVLWRGRLPRIMPGRSAHLPADWTTRADVDGPAVTVRAVSAHRR